MFSSYIWTLLCSSQNSFPDICAVQQGFIESHGRFHSNSSQFAQVSSSARQAHHTPRALHYCMERLLLTIHYSTFTSSLKICLEFDYNQLTPLRILVSLSALVVLNKHSEPDEKLGNEYPHAVGKHSLSTVSTTVYLKVLKHLLLTNPDSQPQG